MLQLKAVVKPDYGGSVRVKCFIVTDRVQTSTRMLALLKHSSPSLPSFLPSFFITTLDKRIEISSFSVIKDKTWGRKEGSEVLFSVLAQGQCDSR